MKIWKILLLILLNIIVSVSATLAVLYYWENIRNKETPIELVAISPSTPTITRPNEPQKQAMEESPAPPSEELPPDETKIAMEISIPPTRGLLVEIPSVVGVGILNEEAIRIKSNTEDPVSLKGWSVHDAQGNSYVFPDIQLIRKGIFIELYSRSGHNTPYELYWNSGDPLWQRGETVELFDAANNLQATYRIP